MDANTEPICLALFFTSGISLERWDRAGMLTREVAIYERMQRAGMRVIFITYGGAADLRHARGLGGIEVCCNRWNLPLPLYERLIPLLHAGSLRRATLLKTNQISGGATALAAARIHAKPLIARCGYMWSDFQRRRHGSSAYPTQRSLATEWQVFGASEAVVVTTETMAASLLERQPWLASRVHVLPNYVDTELFCPSPGEVSPSRHLSRHLCFVGRLDQHQKNLGALLEAVRHLDVTLDVVGDGDLLPELASEATTNPRLRLLGRVPHRELPEILRRAALFVMPSHYEGHPKALIEAMACGTPVMGANVEGIREIIREGENGVLCGPDAASLRRRILDVLADPHLLRRIAQGGRTHALRHYSIDAILERELDLYRSVTRGGRRDR